MEVEIRDTEGKQVGHVPMPKAFSAKPKQWLVERAVIAENTLEIQPQGHYALAGMQTTAAYFGAMMSFRTGRHVGRAIRPREKLGGGGLGKVRRIPSSVTGKRAHPHMVEKTIVEQINKREYSNALKSAVAMSSVQDGKSPFVFDGMNKISKTKDFIKFLNAVNLYDIIKDVKPRKNASMRSSRAKRQPMKMLVVMSDEEGISKPSANIKGVSSCTLSSLQAKKLAPGGHPINIVLWSAKAIAGLDNAIENVSLAKQKKVQKNVNA